RGARARDPRVPARGPRAAGGAQGVRASVRSRATSDLRPSGMSDLEGRCGTCARFVRVIERIDQNGEVTRTGECLLGVWPAPLYETNTCVEYTKRGTLA